MRNTFPKQNKNPRWSGGKPKCLVCRKSINYGYQRCRNHRIVAESTKEKLRQIQLARMAAGEHNNYRGLDKYGNKLFLNLQRRSRKLNAPGSHTLQEWEALKKKYDYMCLCCKKFEPEIKLSEDHIIPLTLGGSDYISNIQPLCRSCNSKKHTDIIDYSNEFGLAKISVA